MIGPAASDGQDQAVQQPAVAVAVIAGAVGLRHQRVEPEQQAHAEDREGDVDRVADAGGADRRRSERRDHDRVDDAHAHPAELGQHDGHRQTQHRAKFRPEGRGHRDNDEAASYHRGR